MAEYDDIPDLLKRDLKAAAPRLDVTPATDARVRAAGRAALVRRPSTWRWAAGVAAVLAVTTFLVVVSQSDVRHNAELSARRFAAKAARLPDDVTGDGVVDVRDALVLAQRLAAGGGKPVPAPWDAATALGKADVDRILARIVRVDADAGAARLPRPSDDAPSFQSFPSPPSSPPIATACDLGGPLAGGEPSSRGAP